MQDIERIDQILQNHRPSYDWAVDTSPEFIEQNGFFAVSRAFIKALLCLLARKGPRSFDSGKPVLLDNDWLKRANSKNYHHFFPKAWLKKRGFEDRRINHIANITLVDEHLNKKVIKAQAPSVYISRLAEENEKLEQTLATHFIGKPAMCGITNDDYDLFFSKRCRKLSAALRKLILPAEIDQTMTAVAASETIDASTMDDEIRGDEAL